MMEKPSESLKRTCLICGCHTNQTINIYEPRGGPNIVQLIQAKFKFQPLNEDKYLCYSCNNWLINWHSLQALNSNDAGSPSGTYRAQQLNGGTGNEKSGAGAGAGGVHQRHHTTGNGGCKPVATVRPRQMLESTNQTHQTITAAMATTTAFLTPAQQQQQQPPQQHQQHQQLVKAKVNCFSKSLRRSSANLMRYKSRHACRVCGCSLFVRMRKPTTAMTAAAAATIKCRRCREILKWRSVYERTLAKAQRKCQQMQKQKQRQRQKSHKITTDQLVSIYQNQQQQQKQQQQQQKQQQQQGQNKEIEEQEIESESENENEGQQQQQQHLQRPLVDGKVVAMLRRLGTTLSRENVLSADGDQRRTLPLIMSPAKQRPRWTRQLDDDEILLDFDTAISEVLLPTHTAHIDGTAPTLLAANGNGGRCRRRLAYQMTSEIPSANFNFNINTNTNANANDNNHNSASSDNRQPLTSLSLRGLSVSLVEGV